MSDHKLTVLIPREDYRPVKVKAAELGVTVSDVVRELLAKWLAGEIKTEAESGG